MRSSSGVVLVLIAVSALGAGTRILAGPATAIASDALSPAQNPPARRAMTDRDLLDFVWLADPEISPDGTTVAVARVTADREHNRYASQIWIVPADGSAPPRALTTGVDDTMPRWSPDGTRLSFLRAIEHDGERVTQVFALDMRGGGEARPLTALPDGVTDFTWRPDGRALAVTSGVAGPKPSPEAEAGRPKASDVRVITRATFRENGAGYRDSARRSRIFLVDLRVDGGEPSPGKALPGQRITEQDAVFAPDGQTLFFDSRDVEEADFTQPRTVVYAAGPTGEPRVVATIDGTVGDLVPSPDGKALAFAGTPSVLPTRSYAETDLFVLDLASGAVRNLTSSYDGGIAEGLTGDQRAPPGSSSTAPVWDASGRSLRVIAARQAKSNVVRVDLASMAVSELTTGDHEVQGCTASHDGHTLVTLVASPTNVGDLFVVSPGAGAASAPRRVTSVNQARFDALDLPEPHEFWFASFDGRRIEGWYLTPPGFDASKKYPMVLQIHGGPHAAYGYTFTHEFLSQAARGYVVVYINPRGSTTYGGDFANVIQYHYPGDDYQDLMKGVDEIVGRGFMDSSKLGVTGGSGGGLLTNWIVGHTTRFRAAVSQRSIADWEAWWYAADFTLFLPRWFEKAPWDDRADYAARSPITYADQIRTPMMFIDGDADYRTPPVAGGEAMFRALKLRHVPTVMIRVPNESHELSRSGQPWHRIDRLRHLNNWFEKWLQDKPHAEYDLP